MKRFARLDVSLATTAIWVVDDQGQVVFEGSVTTDPDAIAAALAPGATAPLTCEVLHTIVNTARVTFELRKRCH